ncbi:TetR/AcrR family transcriptional regulator [Microbispora triticiradicis]|uniref:TetR/AcrR family transcriptional regulator n=3 Tax=Microbispora TaxID=2005 RepID=A0ABY3M084_9ACTN|nr:MULTISPECIES: TetR/AcrR family transcriptional regulator [Microbispora]RGA05400.1 TetR/AcrR family transcriptional regulator [Microbispora triticiradicis]TLP60709.1 TetR/AcrR family transcriptional regulator [Microbispora fusca]TYB62009.1 TetR/AcrR family transcriptional regulator [Microbispora tritici]
MKTESSLRERLVEVGVHLVMTEGAAAVGLREIARRAGVSHGAPRRYFPTHHSLLSAIARRGFADLEARFSAAMAGLTSPRDLLGVFAREYVAYALECRGMFELMFRHELLDSDRHGSDGPRLRESTLPLFERLVALVAECRSAASPPEEPAVTAAAFWSALHGLAQLWTWGSLRLVLDAHGAVPDGERLDRLVAEVLDAHLGPAVP